MNDVDRVLSFWLEPKPRTEEETAARYRFWFYGDDTVDREIRARFTELTARARSGELDAWAQTARGALALIILIDQFSRNVYRGTAEAFACDAKALKLAMALCDSDGIESVDFARKHLDVIARFGRFPHRNKVLGRTSTADEREYLDYLQLAGQWL